MPLTARQREHVLGLVMEVCPECASVQIAEVLSIEERPELLNVLPLGPWRRLKLMIECDACCARRPCSRRHYGEIVSPMMRVGMQELVSRSNPLLQSLLDQGIDPCQKPDRRDMRAEIRKPLLVFLLRQYDRDYLNLRHAPLVDLMLPWSVMTVIGWGVLWGVLKLYPPPNGPLWRFWSLMMLVLVLSGAICAVLIGVPVMLRRRRRARALLRDFQAECTALGATHEEVVDAVRFGRRSGWSLARWA